MRGCGRADRGRLPPPAIRTALRTMLLELRSMEPARRELLTMALAPRARPLELGRPASALRRPLVRCAGIRVVEPGATAPRYVAGSAGARVAAPGRSGRCAASARSRCPARLRKR